MADVIVPAKKLKQARLSFGKPLSKSCENKENIHDKNVHQAPKAQTNSANKDNVLSSNKIQVKADVHSTIQCPEVSTSIHSDSENETKIDSMVERNIDEAIDAVIYRATNDRDNFVESCLLRDSKKRRRSKSPNPTVSNTKETDVSESSLNKSLPISAGISYEPIIIVESPNDIENKPKKPRRSVLDMLNTSKHAETQKSEPSTDKMVDKEVIEIETDSEKEEETPKNDQSSKTNVESVEVGTTVDNDVIIVDAENEDDAGGVGNNVRNEMDGEMDSPAKESHVAEGLSVSPTSTKKHPSPKQRSARKLTSEALKKKEEREREKEERRRLKEEEKHLKEMEKLEQKKKREEERAQRDEEKRKKKEEVDRMKEERLKKKQEEQDKKKAEQEAKRLEKEKREEERVREKEKKEAERKQKEEEKQKILEEKQKVEDEKRRIREKQATTFKNFFTSPSSGKRVLRRSIGDFVQFQLKEDMFLAPATRKSLTTVKMAALETLLKNQTEGPLYVQEIKAGKRKLEKGEPTLPHKRNKLLSLTEDGLEVINIDENSRSSVKPLKAKLLQFSENNRPPYYGTWRKQSKVIKGKRPFQKDTDLLDYEIDSDDEWEDPGEGEDIANSDGEEEVEKDEDEDEGDGFFVPHGYLSDDEGIDADGEANDDLSEQKLKMKQQEFENSFKQKIKVLTPFIVGCIWPDNQENANKRHMQTLDEFKIMVFDESPIDLDLSQTVVQRTPRAKPEVCKPVRQPRNVPEEAIPDLIRMLHGNPHSAQRLVKEFQAYWQKANESKAQSSTNEVPMETESDSTSADKEVSDLLVPPKSEGCKSPQRPLSTSPKPASKTGETSANGSLADVTIFAPVDKGPFWIPKSQVLKKIKEIGVYGRRDTLSRSCWFVLDEVFEKYSLEREKFPIPCNWDYVTKVPDLKLCLLSEVVQPTSSGAPEAKEPAPVAPKMNIHKFTAKVSAETLLSNSLKKGLEEKEKQTSQAQESKPTINKFATSKVSAEELIESSRQKLMQQQQGPRRVELTTIALGNTPEWAEMNEVPPHSTVFGVPTHAAFKNFFGMEKETAQKDSAVKTPVESAEAKGETTTGEVAKSNGDGRSGSQKCEAVECMVVD